jgi:hypothetical protein
MAEMNLQLVRAKVAASSQKAAREAQVQLEIEMFQAEMDLIGPPIPSWRDSIKDPQKRGFASPAQTHNFPESVSISRASCYISVGSR